MRYGRVTSCVHKLVATSRSRDASLRSPHLFACKRKHAVTHYYRASSNMLVSQRGRPKLSFDGHLYVQDKISRSGHLQFWRCQHLGLCKARLHTDVDSNEVVKVIGEHSDEGNPAEVELAGKIQEMKQRAMSTQETPLQLIENVFESCSQAAKLVAPSHATLSRAINRAKKAASRAPALPPNRTAIAIPQEYATYESAPGCRESFIIADSGEN